MTKDFFDGITEYPIECKACPHTARKEGCPNTGCPLAYLQSDALARVREKIDELIENHKKIVKCGCDKNTSCEECFDFVIEVYDVFGVSEKPSAKGGGKK